MNKKVFTTPKNKNSKKRVCESAEQVSIRVRVTVRVWVRVKVSDLCLIFLIFTDPDEENLKEKI